MATRARKSLHYVVPVCGHVALGKYAVKSVRSHRSAPHNE